MRIALLGTCQVHGIGDAVRVLAEGAEILAFEEAGLATPEARASAVAAIEASDLLLTQYLTEAAGPLATEALRPRAARIQMLPTLGFHGFHPDCVYMRHGGRNWDSPLGPYNSAIVAAAFARGLPAERVPALFGAEVLGALGYLDAFAAAEAGLRQQLAAAGLDLDAEWPRLRAAGVFMHTINHPRPPLLAGVARLALLRAGVTGPEAETPALTYDWLSIFPIWPVHPALARHLGVPGCPLFKRHGGVQHDGRGVHLTLREFIAGSYARYAVYPPEVFTVPEVARVRAALGALV